MGAMAQKVSIRVSRLHRSSLLPTASAILARSLIHGKAFAVLLKDVASYSVKVVWSFSGPMDPFDNHNGPLLPGSLMLRCKKTSAGVPLRELNHLTIFAKRPWLQCSVQMTELCNLVTGLEQRRSTHVSYMAVPTNRIDKSWWRVRRNADGHVRKTTQIRPFVGNSHCAPGMVATIERYAE